MAVKRESRTALVIREANAIARARSGRRHGHRGGFTIPLAVVAGFVPLTIGLWGRRSQPQEMARFATVAFTGYDYVGHRWTGDFLGQGIGSVLLGMVIHKGANALGVNRALSRAKIPFFRI